MAEYVQYIVGINWPQGMEWLIILVVALLIFGKRLPDVARGLGKSLTSFKKGLREAEETKDELADEVKKVKDDVTKEARNAAGLDDLDNKT